MYNFVKLGKKILFIIIIFVAMLNVCSYRSFASDTTIVTTVEDLEEALKNAKKNATQSNTHEIVLNSDSFTLNSEIAIPSYTNVTTKKGITININGQIVMNENSTLNLNKSILNYNGKSSAYAIYVKPGANNVKIHNGTIIGGGIYVKQAKNSDISDVTVKKYQDSGIYLLESSSKELKNINCQGGKKGISLKLSTAEKIDSCNISNFTTTGIELYTGSTIKGDISNNTIINGKGTAITLTGPTDKINGSSAKDIINNNIKNCTGDGIGIYHASYCKKISNNIIDTIGGNHDGKDGDYGIIIDSMMKANTYCEQINNNTIKNVTYAGIAVYSGPAASLNNIYQDTAYVEKNIENNVLENCGTYKPSKDWKKEIASGGKKGCLSGIYVDTHARVKGDICNNKITKTGEHGVYIHLCSYVKNIYNNIIDNTAEVGIEIYHATVTGNIFNNTIKNAGTDGIACGNKGVVKEKIYNNKITSTKECGVYLINSKVGNIQNNQITEAKKEGIYVRDKSTVKNIKLNNIKMNNYKTGCGIKVVTNSKVDNILQNTISGKMVYGIRISEASNKVLISKNKIVTNNAAKKAFTSIYANGKSSATFNIKDNNVSGNKTNYGIRIKNGKANIINNKVNKATYPIYIENNKNSAMIKNNTLNKNKKNIIKINKKYFNPKAVTLSNIKNAKGNKAELKWKKYNEVKNYEIYQATSLKGSYKKIKTVKNNNYVVSKLTKGKTYYYKVCGYLKYGNVMVYTKDSNIKNVKISK